MNNTRVKTPRAAFGKLLLNESRLAWRIPIGLGMGLGIPLLLLVVFAILPERGKRKAISAAYLILPLPFRYSLR